MQLPYDSAIVLLGIYPRKIKIYVHTEPCTQTFIVVLVTRAPNWNQPRCSSTGEQSLIRSNQGILLSGKRHELTVHAITWRDPQRNGQSQKMMRCMTPFKDTAEMTRLQT